VRSTTLQRVLPNHLNLPAWHRLLHSLKLPRERLFEKNFARIGHVTVSDAFINLADCDSLIPGGPCLPFARGVGGFRLQRFFSDKRGACSAHYLSQAYASLCVN
jgi:hypothetical protein